MLCIHLIPDGTTNAEQCHRGVQADRGIRCISYLHSRAHSKHVVSSAFIHHDSQVFYPIFDLPVQSLQTICGHSIPPDPRLSPRQKAMCEKLISSNYQNHIPTAETITIHHWVHLWLRHQGFAYQKADFKSLVPGGMVWKWVPQ